MHVAWVIMPSILAHTFSSVQFSLLTDWVVGGERGGGTWETVQQRPFSSLFRWRSSREKFWHEQGCPLLDVAHPAFPMPTTASPSFQGALKDGFGEAVVACDMPEPCKFPSLDSCQKRFLWTYKEVDLAPHQDVGLCYQQEMRRSFLRHLVLKAWIFFFPRDNKHIHTYHKNDEVTETQENHKGRRRGEGREDHI